MLAAAMLVGLTVKTPLASVRATFTVSPMKRPVTAKVCCWLFSRSVEKVSDAGLTTSVGVAACAVPVMGTVTELAPLLLRVRVALVVPAAVGA